jgi:DNA-binding IscR family transcriptional regulator
VECVEDTTVCERSDTCPTRLLWKEACDAMFDRLKAVTLADLVKKVKAEGAKKFGEVPESSKTS